MNDLLKIINFVAEAEQFKETEGYKDMPLNLRDFFNEELGRFKLLLELNGKNEVLHSHDCECEKCEDKWKKVQESLQAGQKKNSEK